MSYIFNNEIAYSDTPNLDAFGRLRTSNITSLVEYKHINDKLPLLIDEITAGTATSVFDRFNAQVVMSTSNSGDYVIRQGKARGIYQPGKSQLIEATFSNFNLEENVIKRVGYFTTTTSAPYDTIYDGILLESNGQTNVISFQIWQSGTTIYSAETTSWLTDDYDVSNVDWRKGQILYIDYQWLGIGRVRFGLVIDGVTRIFTKFTAANNINHVYMSSPNQPIRYEIRQVGDGSGTMDMICSQVSMEGSLNELFRTLGLQAFTIQTLATAGTKYPLIGFRLNNTGWPGSNISLSTVSILNTTTPSKSDFYFTVEFNPTLSSASSWTAVTNTPVEYSLGTGRTVTTSGYVMANILGAGSSAQVDGFDLRDNIIRPGTNINGTVDEVWLCVVSAGNNQDFRSAINLNYYI